MDNLQSRDSTVNFRCGAWGFSGFGLRIWGCPSSLCCLSFYYLFTMTTTVCGAPTNVVPVVFFPPILPDWGVKSLIHFYVRPNNKTKCQICCEMLNCLSTDWGTATTTTITTTTTATKTTTTTGYWNMTMTFGVGGSLGRVFCDKSK